MKLTEKEANLFYELMHSLQLFVNNKCKITTSADTLKEYKMLPMKEQLLVRDAVFKDTSLIDCYVSKNPDQLDAEKLEIVQNWKEYLKDKFYIERYLKDYAVFIGDNKVYGVLALLSDFDQMFHKSRLPICVETVLLPFRGKIIYDGLMQTYNIFFGGGIKRNLKETYMKAKQNNKIIFSLGQTTKMTSSKKAKEVVQNVGWSEELEQLISISKKLKGGSDQPQINGLLFSLVKNSVELLNNALTDTSDADALLQEFKKVEKAVSKVKKYLDLAD